MIAHRMAGGDAIAALFNGHSSQEFVSNLSRDFFNPASRAFRRRPHIHFGYRDREREPLGKAPHELGIFIGFARPKLMIQVSDVKMTVVSRGLRIGVVCVTQPRCFPDNRCALFFANYRAGPSKPCNKSHHHVKQCHRVGTARDCNDYPASPVEHAVPLGEEPDLVKCLVHSDRRIARLERKSKKAERQKNKRNTDSRGAVIRAVLFPALSHVFPVPGFVKIRLEAEARSILHKPPID